MMTIGVISTYETLGGLTIADIRNETSCDRVLQQVARSIITQQWDNPILKPYKQIHKELTLSNGLLLRGNNSYPKITPEEKCENSS